VKASTGAGDANKLPVLGDDGKLDSDFIPTSDLRFGTGADGAYTLNAAQAAVSGLFSKVGNTFTLLRDANFTDLTVEDTYILNPNGFIFRVSGTMAGPVSGTAKIQSNGGNGGAGTDAGSSYPGTGGIAGAKAHTGGTLPDPAAAGAGGAANNGASGGAVGENGESVNPGIGSTGAAGGTGEAGGGSARTGGTGGTVTWGGAGYGDEIFKSILALAIDSLNWFIQFKGNGGAGGGGAGTSSNGSENNRANGAGAGGTGGNVQFYARTITGLWTFEAKGGIGGAGFNATRDSGAGGGGSGGLIIYFYHDKSGATITIDVTGGAAGATAPAASAAAAGVNGSSYAIKI
jgi:hypothetical protein